MRIGFLPCNSASSDCGGDRGFVRRDAGDRVESPVSGDESRTGICIASAAALSAQALAFDIVGRHAIMSDPDWLGGDYYDTAARRIMDWPSPARSAHSLPIPEMMATNSGGRSARGSEVEEGPAAAETPSGPTSRWRATWITRGRSSSTVLTPIPIFTSPRRWTSTISSTIRHAGEGVRVDQGRSCSWWL